MDTDLTAANGKKVKALEIFAYALQYFKEQALKVGTYQSLYCGGAQNVGFVFRKQDAAMCAAGGEGAWGNCWGEQPGSSSKG